MSAWSRRILWLCGIGLIIAVAAFVRTETTPVPKEWLAHPILKVPPGAVRLVLDKHNASDGGFMGISTDAAAIATNASPKSAAELRSYYLSTYPQLKDTGFRELYDRTPFLSISVAIESELLNDHSGNPLIGPRGTRSYSRVTVSAGFG